MIRKDENFSYDISEFEKKAEKYFPGEDIVVGAMDGVDEEFIQKFLDDVLEYEIAYKESKKQK